MISRQAPGVDSAGAVVVLVLVAAGALVVLAAVVVAVVVAGVEVAADVVVGAAVVAAEPPSLPHPAATTEMPATASAVIDRRTQPSPLMFSMLNRMVAVTVIRQVGSVAAMPVGRAQRVATTKSRIVAAGLDLFGERGFDGVTMGELAAAAGVSERTVYRHFPTKEDVVLDRAELGGFVAALYQAPWDVHPLDALVPTMRAAAMALPDHELDRRRTELVLRTPSLHAAWITALADIERDLVPWFAGRIGRTADDLEVRVAVAALVAAHRVLVETWDGGNADDYMARAEQVYGLLDVGLAVRLRP